MCDIQPHSSTPCPACGSVDRYPSGRCKPCLKVWAKTRGPCTKCGDTEFNSLGACKPCMRASAKRRRDEARGGPARRPAFLVGEQDTEVCTKCGASDTHVTPSGNKYCRPCQSGASKKYRDSRTPRQMALWRDKTRKWIKRNGRGSGDHRRSGAAPDWLTDEQWDLISEYHELAGDMSMHSTEDYEVDHIVPIMGRDVCGLEVPWNLQVTTRSHNRKKSNRTDYVVPLEHIHHPRTP